MKRALLVVAFAGYAWAQSELLSLAYSHNHELKALESELSALEKEVDLSKIWENPTLSIGVNDIFLNEPLTRDKEMQKRLNLKIKFRESFRPFAPVILKEKVGDYFEKLTESNYMLITTNISLKHRIPLPKHYQDLDAAERLALPKSDIPAVTHVDFSARVQTVDEQSNPKLTKLLRAFEQLTGYPLLINTSFNVRGEPIVCTPQDAYRCFMTTNLDLLVLGNYIINKNNIQKS